jgi:hypothetical protein
MPIEVIGQPDLRHAAEHCILATASGQNHRALLDALPAGRLRAPDAASNLAGDGPPLPQPPFHAGGRLRAANLRGCRAGPLWSCIEGQLVDRDGRTVTKSSQALTASRRPGHRRRRGIAKISAVTGRRSATVPSSSP